MTTPPLSVPSSTRAAAAEPEPYKDSVVGMDFVVIEPGTFEMGSPATEKDREEDETQHRVTLTRGFWMGATEVTQGQWQALVGNNPSRFKACGAAPKRSADPVHRGDRLDPGAEIAHALADAKLRAGR